MNLGPHTGIVIQGTERHAVIRSATKLGDNRRAAHAAKASVISGRRFVERDKALALQPLELCCFCARAASKRASLGLPAHRAMTIWRLRQRPIDPVFHATAQASSSGHA